MPTSPRALTLACSVAKLTLTSCTPGTSASERSTRATQDAQLMPSIGNCHSVSAAAAGGVFKVDVMFMAAV
jgi:hypothetical protein